MDLLRDWLTEMQAHQACDTYGVHRITDFEAMRRDDGAYRFRVKEHIRRRVLAERSAPSLFD